MALLFFNSHSEKFLQTREEKSHTSILCTHYLSNGKSEATIPSTLPGGVDNNSVRQLLLVVLREKEANKKSASYCTLVQ